MNRTIPVSKLTFTAKLLDRDQDIILNFSEIESIDQEDNVFYWLKHDSLLPCKLNSLSVIIPDDCGNPSKSSNL